MPRKGWAEIESRRYVRNQKIRARKRRRKLPPGEASRNALFLAYAGNADRLNREFKLTREEFTLLVQKNCHYCGKIPSQKFRGSGHTEPFLYNGIDRVDSSRGYVVDNCAPCCKICNKMKSALSVSEFLEHVAQIVRHGAAKSEKRIDSGELILPSPELSGVRR